MARERVIVDRYKCDFCNQKWENVVPTMGAPEKKPNWVYISIQIHADDKPRHFEFCSTGCATRAIARLTLNRDNVKPERETSND